MKPFHVKYRVAGSVFFRHVWRVVSATVEGTEDGPSSYVFETKSGKRVEVPVTGTVFVFGKGHVLS